MARLEPVARVDEQHALGAPGSTARPFQEFWIGGGHVAQSTGGRM